MTMRSGPPVARRRRGAGGRALAFLVVLALLGLAFGFGVAVGQAIGEGSRPGGTLTSERTVPPLERPPTAGRGG